MKIEYTFGVKYIYGELDPSEEIIFMRELRQNDDLMIEVEAMRETQKRLDNLPLIDPPSDLSYNIMNYVERKNAEKKNSHSFIYLSVAASFLIFLFSAGYLFMNDTGKENSNSISEASAGKSDILITKSRGKDIQSNSPWIDKNDVIHVNDLYDQPGATYDSIFRSSMQKLTPIINGSQQRIGLNKDVQLTGSRK